MINVSKIERVQTDHYLVPLPRVLVDSMHDQMAGFEVVTTRITDSDGAEGVGYTFTCGVNGGAIALGHPLGGSGAKLMTTLVHALRARGKRFGLQTMCEGGGIANVTIIEAL